MVKLVLGIGGAGLIGYASYSYLQKKKAYDDEVRASIVALYKVDDSLIPSIAKLPANYIDNLVKIYLSNNKDDIATQGDILIKRGYVKTGNAFNKRATQL